jgi:hypothetical protein
MQQEEVNMRNRKPDYIELVDRINKMEKLLKKAALDLATPSVIREEQVKKYTYEILRLERMIETR